MRLGLIRKAFYDFIKEKTGQELTDTEHKQLKALFTEYGRQYYKSVPPKIIEKKPEQKEKRTTGWHTYPPIE